MWQNNIVDNTSENDLNHDTNVYIYKMNLYQNINFVCHYNNTFIFSHSKRVLKSLFSKKKLPLRRNFEKKNKINKLKIYTIYFLSKKYWRCKNRLRERSLNSSWIKWPDGFQPWEQSLDLLSNILRLKILSTQEMISEHSACSSQLVIAFELF